jgi:antitoxin ParD1/3/4
MNAEKVSVTIPKDLYGFIDQYRSAHALKSRSQVVSEALELLRQRELDQAYQAANDEVDTDFDATSSDGLRDETW